MIEQICDRYGWTPPEGAVHLPGFVDKERNVTYESHTFWVEWEWKQPDFRHAIPGQTVPNGAIIWVRHGGGVQRLRVDRHIAPALHRLIEAGDAVMSFHLCWGLHDVARSTASAARAAEKKRLEDAFVRGWLRKRKVTGREAFRVWVEQPDGTTSLSTVRSVEGQA
jgi:hypothetical protein